MAKISTRDKVLNLLTLHKGTAYSGQQLADELSVSRTAIWKAITALRDEGFKIEGSTKSGYVLDFNTDVISDADIMSQLTVEARDFYNLECVKSIDSTNNEVRKRALDGSKEGLCIIAEEQTAGKGRRGRSFYSPDITGIYLSILLRPDMAIEDAVLITTAAAVAGAKACDEVLGWVEKNGDLSNRKEPADKMNSEKSGGKMNSEKTADDVKVNKTVDIKWVNDLFLDGKKFCGILTEAGMDIESGGLDYAVMGIGFNITDPKEGWPEEIAHIAGSLLKDNCPAGTRNKLVALFLNEFYEIYNNLPDVTYLEEYRERSLAIGKSVDVVEANGVRRGAYVTGVDDRCRLLVRFDGEEDIKTLDSGEISIKL